MKKEFYYAVSIPAAYPEERTLEIVEDIEHFSPDLLAEPEIRTIKAKNWRHAVAQLIRQFAEEQYPLNSILVNLSEITYEFSFYLYICDKFPWLNSYGREVLK